MTSASHRRRLLLLPAVLALVGSAVAVPAAAYEPAPGVERRGLLRGRRAAPGPSSPSYAGAGPAADDGVVPQERHQGGRQRPADRGAAQHRRRLVQPRDRRLAGRHTAPPTTRSTSTAPPFTNRTAAFDAGVLQAESIAQSAERGGLKVAQVEWAGGAQRLDPRARRSTTGRSSPGRGVATNFIGSAGDVLFDDRRSSPPSGSSSTTRPGFAGQAPFAGRRPDRRGRLDQRPGLVQPGQGDAPPGPRLRRRQVRAQRLHLRQHERRDDRTTTRSCSRRRRTAPPPSGTLAEGKWADVKVKISGGSLDGKTAGMLVKVEALTPDLSAGPPVPHLRDPRDRHLAGLAGRARLHAATSPSTSPRRSRRRPRPTSRSSRPASPARRPTSSRACTGPRPPADARVRGQDLQAGPPARRLPDDRRVPAPVPGPRHARRCPAVPPTRPTTTSTSTASRTAALPSARRSSAAPTRAPTRP